MRQRSNGGVEVAEPRLNLCKRRLGIRSGKSIGRVISHSASCLLQCLLLVTKTGISKRENDAQLRIIRSNNEIWRGLDCLNCTRKSRMRFVRASGPFLAVTQIDQGERFSRFRRDLLLKECDR